MAILTKIAPITPQAVSQFAEYNLMDFIPILIR